MVRYTGASGLASEVRGADGLCSVLLSTFRGEEFRALPVRIRLRGHWRRLSSEPEGVREVLDLLGVGGREQVQNGPVFGGNPRG